MDRLITDRRDWMLFIRFCEKTYIDTKKAFSVHVDAGRKRSIEQNRLQRLWINEITEQWEGTKHEENRAYCKLMIGVPILCRDSDEYRVAFERDVKPLPYSVRLALFAQPLDMPVTRAMTVKQKMEYLDGIYDHFTHIGFQLTRPDGQELAA